MIKTGLPLLAIALSIDTPKAQDWANIHIYEGDSTRVQPPASGEKRVVFMGNSITDFWITNDSSFFSGKPYFDRGISGQTTGQMLLRFREDVINLQPKVVVILTSINDIAKNNVPSKLKDVFGSIVSMAELAEANHIKVVFPLCCPPRLFRGDRLLTRHQK